MDHARDQQTQGADHQVPLPTGHPLTPAVPLRSADAVRDWWRQKGARQYPGATALLIEAGGGGRNGSKSRRFKLRLQEFADETGLTVTVCHYPPRASKWNSVEYKLFSQITAM